MTPDWIISSDHSVDVLLMGKDWKAKKKKSKDRQISLCLAFNLSLAKCGGWTKWPLRLLPMLPLNNLFNPTMEQKEKSPGLELLYMLHTHTHTHLLDSKVSETNLSSLPLHFQAFIFADVYLSPIVYIHTSADIWNVFPLAFYFSFLSSLVETLVKSFLKATVLVQFMLFSL